MENEPLILNVAKKCARISLLTGIGIFLFFAISRNGELMILGLFYIFFACLANGFILLALLLHLVNHCTWQKKIFYTALIMLSNIPIAIFFAWLAIQISELNHIKL